MSNPLRFTPLANVTPRKRRARYELVRRRQVFAFRLSGWFVVSQVQAPPAGHSGTRSPN